MLSFLVYHAYGSLYPSKICCYWPPPCWALLRREGLTGCRARTNRSPPHEKPRDNLHNLVPNSTSNRRVHDRGGAGEFEQSTEFEVKRTQNRRQRGSNGRGKDAERSNHSTNCTTPQIHSRGIALSIVQTMRVTPEMFVHLAQCALARPMLYSRHAGVTNLGADKITLAPKSDRQRGLGGVAKSTGERALQHTPLILTSFGSSFSSTSGARRLPKGGGSYLLSPHPSAAQRHTLATQRVGSDFAANPPLPTHRLPSH